MFKIMALPVRFGATRTKLCPKVPRNWRFWMAEMFQEPNLAKMVKIANMVKIVAFLSGRAKMVKIAAFLGR